MTVTLVVSVMARISLPGVSDADAEVVHAAGVAGDRQLLADDLQDRHACSRHGTRLSPMSRLTCRVSTVAYVVNPDT
jgi:hypothetical protein